MLRITSVIMLVAATVICNGVAADDRQNKQAELDAACEAARQTALIPKKSEIYQECLEVFKKSAEVCERETADYNGNRVGAGPLFYDLPECVTAFDYRNTR